MAINQTAISGNLVRDPELKSTASGVPVLTFTVAVNDYRKGSDGYEECPNYIPCVLIGPRADALSRILGKGMQVSVAGKLRWSQWERDGRKHERIEVVAREVVLPPRKKAQGASQEEAGRVYGADGSPIDVVDILDADIDF